MEVSLMSGKLLDDLGQLQRAVIEVVWELGEANVHQVRKELARKKKPKARFISMLPHGPASKPATNRFVSLWSECLTGTPC